MYAGFKLKIDTDNFFDVNDMKKFADSYDRLNFVNRAGIEKKLESYLGPDCVIQADNLMKDWFPQVEADVFLSHSHKDETFVKAFAYWLYKEFRITSFIDSCVWGYADKLLKEIDNKFCYNNDDDDDGYYNYSKRNKSTAHVHMMLSSALYKMMDSAECLIFVNTPNSITAEKIIHNAQTYSPWIYSELLYSQFIRHRELREYRNDLQHSMYHLDESTEMVRYNVTTDHLYNMDDTLLCKWEHEKSDVPYKSLDALYQIASLQDNVLAK